MKANSLIWLMLGAWLGAAAASPAQQNDSDRQGLETLKARADQGDPKAEIDLATLYAAGNGVPKDPAKAAKLHRKAAEQGDARGECLLGVDYADGMGVKKNMNEALHWLHKAADKGLAEAQYDLAMCYANGDAEGRGMVEAAEWFHKAADQGMAPAEAALGNAYLEGTGVPKSIPEGLKWTRKAAEQGNPSAELTLGMCYAKGRGVETNYVVAYKWLALAAAKDSQNADDAKISLAMVERMLTPAQVAEGQKEAGEFVPSKGEAEPPRKSAASSATNKPPAPVQAGTGLVTVKADDESAEVYVDGAFVGNAPAKLKLTQGAHVIEVKKAGFKDYRKQLEVGEGSELTLHAALEKP
ncbi:MAG TPA: PEGA domain-containing protein [Candidatus Acidoferrum sp.]|nr:PEGA domain-containing protein [Candidatus Acidoferrum sp.]